jgi:hypothetical protein
MTVNVSPQVKSESEPPKRQQQPYLHSDTADSSSSSSRGGSRNDGAVDSVEKLQRVLQLCDECGVVRQPVMLGGLLLVPLLSWHHKVCMGDGACNSRGQGGTCKVAQNTGVLLRGALMLVPLLSWHHKVWS